MSKSVSVSEKKALLRSKKGENVKIYGRIRSLMPWEGREISLDVKGNSIRNSIKQGIKMNEYSFDKVFKMSSLNIDLFKSIVQPMIDNVLNGFNAVLIAYGQTGSGKTFTMLGKPKLNVVGLLPYMLKELVETPSVYKLELGAVEAFGHHVARIELFDLFDPKNQINDWTQKKGNTSLIVEKSKRVLIKNIDDAYNKIIYAHKASHFAQTGKNPESSRGHVTFLASVYQNNGSMDLISHFVMLDCAGSEGESAFTNEFKKSVSKEILMARRLEAGCINTGLCQLQIIFNELRIKGMLSKMVGNGLRKVLHPYINTRTLLSVVFTFSPSKNNAKATESTLKFAVTAGMVKVKPVKQELKLNLDKLVATLRKDIARNEKTIESQEEEMLVLEGDFRNIKEEAILHEVLVVKDEFSDDYNNAFGLGEELEYCDENFQVQRKTRQKGKKMMTRFNPALSKNLKNKLAMLDDEDESSDSGFEVGAEFLSSKELEFECDKAMKERLKESDKNSNAKHILKKMGIDVDLKDNDNVDIESLVYEEESKELMEELTKSTRIMPDFNKMSVEELKNLIKSDWEDIEQMKIEQEGLKETQSYVIDHLVETNEWLFNSLQQIFDEKV